MNNLSNASKLAIVIVAGILVLGVLVLMDWSTQPMPGDEAGQSATFNRADLMFMNMMIIHHDQAVKMAELAPNRTNDEAVLRLAQNISEAQRRENEQMASWLRSQGHDRPTRGHRMAGMASPKEMMLLEQSSGQEFNKRFAELMIDHHEGGIQMARTETRRGSHDDLVSLAEDMVRVQQREVDLMQRWLDGWNE